MSIAETMERRAREFVDRYTAIREQIGRVIVTLPCFLSRHNDPQPFLRFIIWLIRARFPT